jgi:hypothetical protein
MLTFPELSVANRHADIPIIFVTYGLNKREIIFCVAYL